MTKDEYISMLNTNIAINSIVSGFSEKVSGKIDGLKKAIDLAEKLDEPKKVIIPQFVDNWIEECDKCLIKDPVDIVRCVAEDCGLSAQDDWLDDIDNQKLLLNAVANGYEVKEDAQKEKFYEFLIPTAYQCLYDTGEEVAILPYKYDGAKSAMTMERAKTWTHFNAYNDAGLLHITGVDDD